MPLPAHAKIQLQGSLNAGSGPAEIWTSGIAVTIGTPAGSFLHDPQGVANDLAPVLGAWFNAAGHGMAQNATLDLVKVNNINPDGTYKDAVTHQASVPAPRAGGAAQTVPAFCSVAATLETGLTRGYAHRGRIYLPNYTYAVSGSNLSGTDALAVVNSVKALLNAIQTVTDGPTHYLMQPCVVSTHGALNVITGVSADNIWDVQRRRKNRLTSTRTSAAWP